MVWLSRGTPERETMNKWRLIHSYSRIAKEGLVEDIVCPDDKTTLISLIDTVNTDNEDPVMWCPYCNSRYHLGLNAWDQISAAVEEHWNPLWSG